MSQGFASLVLQRLQDGQKRKKPKTLEPWALKVNAPALRVWGLGFRVRGLGFRV